MVIRARHEVAVDADRAQLFVTVEGSSLVTGRAALKKAAEVRGLVEALAGAGVEADAIALEGVHAVMRSGFLGRSSSATYRLRIDCDDLSRLPDVLGAITGAKNATLGELAWRYPDSPEQQAQWLARCVEKANVKARAAAHAFGATIVGIHRMEEQSLDEPRSPHHLAAPGVAVRARMQSSASVDLGMELGHQKRSGLAVTVEYRVEGATELSG